MAHSGGSGAFYDESGELFVPGSQHEGWNEEPAYAAWYAQQMAHGAQERQSGGLGGQFIDIDRIAGGANAAWEFGQRGEVEAGIVGMGPTQLPYDPRSNPTVRRAKPRGT